MIIRYAEHLRTIYTRRRIGYCIAGSRRFFERYGLDFDDFVKNGIESDILLSASNNNALAVKLVEHAERVENGK